MTRSARFIEPLLALAPVVLALAFTSVLLVAVGAPPGQAYLHILRGAFESPTKVADVFGFWVPLMLCSVGLLLTFTAGLWNIGVEGQIVVGALFTSWVARNVFLPSAILIPLELIAALVGGALWGLLAGVLKTRGSVHEIFGGLALTNIALILTNYMISGPWQPPEGGSLQGTTPFQPAALLPRFAGMRLSPVAVALALVAFVAVYFALRGTFWGLQLKALGSNPRSAFLLGVATERHVLLSMAACGALAGLAGAVRAVSFYGNLRPLISGGIGFLAILVVLLASIRALWVPFIAFFFAAVMGGSLRLQIQTQLHNSLGGILQGALVLFVILMHGVRQRMGGGQRIAVGEAD
ncbi:MAG: ABC transporter permease [Anaerolineae bacterium]